MTQTMKAFVLKGHGDFDQLQWHEDWPIPVASLSERDQLLPFLEPKT